jgi:hypothetical protein
VIHLLTDLWVVELKNGETDQWTNGWKVGWIHGTGHRGVRGCIQKFPDRFDNEIYAYNNKHSLRSNTKDYGGKTH